MKKILALVVALMLVLSMTAAFAGSKVTINKKANDTAAHTYEAYQIFSGVVDGGQLKQIEWGTGVEVDALKTALATAFGSSNTATTKVKTPAEGSTPAVYYTVGEVFTDAATVNTAAAYAEAMGYLTAEADRELLADTIGTNLSGTTSGTPGNDGVSNLDPGYYMIKDQDNSIAAGEQGAYTKFILNIVGEDISVTEKADVPSVDKTVQDETGDAETGATDGYGETADHDINETFNFKVVATIPADVELVDYETYKVNFVDTMSAGVTYEGITSVTVNTTHTIEPYDATTNPHGYKLNTDAIGANGGGSFQLAIDDILPILSDTEKAAAVTVTVIYTAHLNENAVVSQSSETAFTGNQNKVKLEYSNNANAGANGEYGTTPEDYVWVFTFDKENIKYADSVASGNELENAGFRLYSVSGQTETEIPVIFDTTKGAYRPIASSETSEEMRSSSDAATKGQFKIIGLDAGTYRLKETTVPTGYNPVADIDFTIGAVHSENAGGANASMTLTNDSRHSDIIDLSGTTLPSTGGIGTTIFYVGGGLLVLAAVILLVTKRRMSGND